MEDDPKTKSSIWLGTYYPTEEELDTFLPAEWIASKFKQFKCRYMNGQYEKCPSTDKLHVQYYLNFKDPVRRSALKKSCNRSHFKKVEKDNA